MAENNSSPHIVSPRGGTAIIDTTAPFESVRAAVSLFGEKADFNERDGKGRRLPSSAEKRIALESDLRRGHEDLSRLKEQLTETEKAHAKAVHELETTLAAKTKALEEALSSHAKAVEAANGEKLQADEVLSAKSKELAERNKAWEAEVSQLQQQLSNVTAQLQSAGHDIEKLKAELQRTAEATGQQSLAHADEINKAKNEAEAAAALRQEEIETLKGKVLRTEEALAGVKVANAKLESERAALSAELAELKAGAVANKKEIEDLKKQLTSAKELEVELAAATLAAEKLKKDVAYLKDSGAKSAASDKEEILELKKQLTAVKESEGKLASATLAVEKLEKDVAALKESEARASAEIRELKSIESKLKVELDEVKAAKAASEAELEQTRTLLNRLQVEEESLRGAFATLQSAYDKENVELSELKVKHGKAAGDLQQALSQIKILQEEEASLRSSFNSLRADYDTEHTELVDLKIKDSRSAEEYSALAGDLEKTIADLSSVSAAEAKAKEQVGALTEALHQVTAEADSAKKLVSQCTEDAAKAKAEAEQAKAALDTTERRLQAALKEVEAAKAAETLALSECKNLMEKHSEQGEPAAGEKEAGAEVTLSREEYDALKKKIVEVEDVSKKKVEAALAQWAASQAAERELVTRLQATLSDLDISREAAGLALKRAEKAEEAKSKIEGELRKHRSENEQRRKGADHSRELGLGSGIGTPPTRVDSDLMSGTPVGSRQQSGELYKPARAGKQSESLGQFLNIHMPVTQEKEDPIVETPRPSPVAVGSTTVPKRKRSFQAVVKAIFGKGQKTRANGSKTV